MMGGGGCPLDTVQFTNKITNCIMESGSSLMVCVHVILSIVSVHPSFSYLAINGNEFGSKRNTVFDKLLRMEYNSYISNLFLTSHR